jgi:hypothetical protein
MLAFPFLITAGVCALVPVSKASAADLLQLLPKEEKMHVRKLANGVTTLVQENQFPVHGAALRVVVQSLLHGDVLYSLDTSIDNMDEIDQFLRNCRDNCHGSLPNEVFKEGDLLLQSGIPAQKSSENLAVIAIGDFSPSSMQTMIENYFGSIKLEQVGTQSRMPIQIGLSSFPAGVALHIDYPILSNGVKTVGDLKESWLQIFAQDLLQQRLERLTRALRENWVHPHPRSMFPVHGFALASEDTSPNILSFLLWEIEQIKIDGFNENEFLAVQDRVSYQLNYLARNFSNADSSKIASYYADGIRSGADSLSYETFLQVSEELVPSLSFDEVKPYVRKLLQDANRFIHIRYPENHRSHLLTASEIEEMVHRISGLAEFDSDAYYDEDDVMLLKNGNAKHSRLPERELRPIMLAHEPAVLMVNGTQPQEQAPAQEAEIDYFQLLQLTNSERDKISYIITNMGKKNIFELAFIKGKMEEKGKQIHHVHPLRFIGHIFSDPELKSCMRKIRKSSFKWDAFMDGFGKKMKDEGAKNNLLMYVPGFAKQVNANPEKITYYIQHKDWEGLIRHLL